MTTTFGAASSLAWSLAQRHGGGMMFACAALILQAKQRQSNTGFGLVGDLDESSQGGAGSLLRLRRQRRLRRVNPRAKITQRQRCRKPLELQERATWGKERIEILWLQGEDVVVLVERRRQTQTNLLGENCAVVWGGKKTDLRADLGPFFSAQSNLSSWRGRGRE